MHFEGQEDGDIIQRSFLEESQDGECVLFHLRLGRAQSLGPNTYNNFACSEFDSDESDDIYD